MLLNVSVDVELKSTNAGDADANGDLVNGSDGDLAGGRLDADDREQAQAAEALPDYKPGGGRRRADAEHEGDSSGH